MKSALVAAAFALIAAQSTNVDPLLAKLDAYLVAYEPRLSELIADEVMTQQMSAAALSSTPPDQRLVGRDARRRQLTSEVAFIALPDGGWLGFRHVRTVNTKPVGEVGVQLANALRGSSYDSARALLQESAAHNLGLPRTTNLPNLPLEFLHPRNRLRLLARFDGTETVRGIKTTRLVLHERVTPTLIRNPQTGGDMPSTIRAWIDPQHGRLLRAEVRTFASPYEMEIAQNTIRVEFAENAALGVLVPIEMRERFPIVGEHRGSSVARYSNFRRFTTSARIVQ